MLAVHSIAIAQSPPASEDDLAAIPDARVRAIERARRDKRISHGALLRGSGVHRSTWSDLRRGLRAPKDETLRKLNAVIEGVKAKPKPEAIVAFYRALMVMLATETGADPELMLAQDFSSEKPHVPDWLRAARLRRLAIYITAVELAIDSNAALGRAIGCSRQNVKQARDQVEDLRESDIAIAALIAKSADLLTGRG